MFEAGPDLDYHKLTNKGESTISPCDCPEIIGDGVPHVVNVLLHSETIKLVVKQRVVVHVNDGSGEFFSEIEELGRRCRQPVGHDHIGLGRVLPDFPVGVLVVPFQAIQGHAGSQQLVH